MDNTHKKESAQDSEGENLEPSSMAYDKSSKLLEVFASSVGRPDEELGKSEAENDDLSRKFFVSDL